MASSTFQTKDTLAGSGSEVSQPSARPRPYETPAGARRGTWSLAQPFSTAGRRAHATVAGEDLPQPASQVLGGRAAEPPGHDHRVPAVAHPYEPPVLGAAAPGRSRAFVYLDGGTGAQRSPAGTVFHISTAVHTLPPRTHLSVANYCYCLFAPFGCNI
jgi:hypothetical protein